MDFFTTHWREKRWEGMPCLWLEPAFLSAAPPLRRPLHSPCWPAFPPALGTYPFALAFLAGSTRLSSGSLRSPPLRRPPECQPCGEHKCKRCREYVPCRAAQI